MNSNVVVAGKHRRRVRFPSKIHHHQPSSSSSSNLTSSAHGSDSRTAKKFNKSDKLSLSSSERQPQAHLTRKIKSNSKIKSKSKTMASGSAIECQPGVPQLFAQRPTIRDSLITETSKSQDETVDVCLPSMKGIESSQHGPFNKFGTPRLYREANIAFLRDALESYPARFVGLDASRPWMVYWAVTGLYLLGEDVTKLRRRVISTAAPMQNPTGGFGGGHGQTSHCAPSYALVLSLASVGDAEAFKLVDRLAMWKWLGQLKQPDGGFRVGIDGEEDVRGAYCVMVIVALLDLPEELPPDAPAREFGHDTFMSGLPEYLSRCQTFEGGISGSPGTEAHGAYAFCALACLCIMGNPWEMLEKYLDLPLLISWLSSRQYAPEGGFAGRTNKLVDGCYSHWVGGCWPLVQAALNGSTADSNPDAAKVGSLYNREGLTRYILSCCQFPHGGLRDKPGKHPDSYHTCYIMAGLSNVQSYHYNTYSKFQPPTRGAFSSSFSWKHSPVTSKSTTKDENEDIVFEEADRLNQLHPLFSISHSAAENMRSWYESNPIAEFTTA